ncbi:ataxin-10-like [Coregonus clupeaformis]|uniref:ataxin-10-like n=1 Tax=Coregonus clupeaformis TaxID=59861 RepID=UPI001E1C7CA5|nr:ataxin-10-like [Coregonus clupeaformis]
MLQKLKSENTDYIFEALRCGIQLIGNLAVDNQFCKDDIWRLIFPDLLWALLCVDDERAVGYSSMVLHTCLDEHKVEQLAQTGNIHLALKVMELCRTQSELDWTVLIATQHFLKSSVLVKNMYAGMSHQERVTLLQLISAQLGEEDSKDCGIPPTVATFLASCFQERCGAVLTLASKSDNEEALTVISLLDVLCEMTSDHKQFMFLQNHPDLLKSTVDLLQQVHALGKTSKNVLSPNEGNMFCHQQQTSDKQYRHTTHRHTAVRELDGLPLIMDNCSIDSNNPFISQWAIFATRNILEHNLENQELVAALERCGVADDSALRAMGFRVEKRDGNMLLKPCSKDP